MKRSEYLSQTIATVAELEPQVRNMSADPFGSFVERLGAFNRDHVLEFSTRPNCRRRVVRAGLDEILQFELILQPADLLRTSAESHRTHFHLPRDPTIVAQL